MKLRLPTICLAGVQSQISAAALLLLLASTSFAAEPPPLPPVTSVSGSPRLPGKFVWADLVTDDVAGAVNLSEAVSRLKTVPPDGNLA